MEIKRGSEVVCDVYLDDDSYTTEEIMGEHTLVLKFLSRNVVDLRIDDYVEFSGVTYKIRHNEKVTKRETSLGWEYNVTFYAPRYTLQDVGFFLSGTPQRKKNADSYTGTASDWLQLMVKNMNRGDEGWSAGECIESRYVTLSFRDKTVSSVLDELAQELDTEYWINGKVINIGKQEISSDGLVLAQGKGLGFTELELSAVNDTPPVTVLYPYGSDTNIASDYGSDYLILPGGALSIEKNVDKYGRREQSLQFSHIYPKGEFVVTERIDDFTLRASGIDFNLTDCLLDGVEAVVTFQDGALAGYELAIADGSWDNATKQFRLVQNEEENALKVPGDINFSTGDRFILSGLKMPQSYIDAAEQQLLQEATAWLDENSEELVQLKGTCDEITFRLKDISIACGQMVGVYSEPLGIDREIRTTKVKRYLNNDGTPSYKYEITLSDFLESNGFKDLVNEVSNLPEEVFRKDKETVNYTKRRFRDAKETMEMLEESLLDTFTNSISPITVQTMQMLVGDESLQFRFVDSKTSPAAVNPGITYDNTTKQLTIPKNILQHMTLGITAITPSHDASEYKYWDMAAYTSAVLAEANKRYYLYAKVAKDGTTGEFLLSETAIKMEGVDGYYHLLVGTLGTEYDGTRSFATLYGFTEVLPGRITTEKIVSSDGTSYFDMESSALKLGDALDFNSAGDGKLKLKGTIVQSQSGDESPVGCFRGTYNSSYTYYNGDIVTYDNGNGTSTYRYIYDTPKSGNPPSSSTYWAVIAAQGTDGTSGSYYEYRYAVNGSATAPPTIDKKSSSPSGWSTSMPSVSTGYYLWCTVAKKDYLGSLQTSWSTPVRLTGKDGADGIGKDGATGPALVFRGEYDGDTPATYYGNATRVDAVKYGSTYYVARTDAGEFSGKAPTNTSYWNTFGASFESIATGLLLAEAANIAGWMFSNECIYSQSSTMRLDGRKSPKTNLHIAVGADAANTPGSAPFRVDTTGKVYAGNATVKGTIQADTIVCNNFTQWGAPGLLAIGHIGTSTTITSVCSVGGVKFTTISTGSAGKHTVKFSGLDHTNYTVLWQGISYTTTGQGFRGTIGVLSKTSSSFVIHCIDTDNNNHNLLDDALQIDLILIGYPKSTT